MSKPERGDLTLGERRVGINFNPSSNHSVDQFKRLAADAIDKLESMREDPEATSETQRTISRAQTFFEDASVQAVKAHFIR